MSNRLFFPKNDILVPYQQSMISNEYAQDYLKQAKGLLYQDNYPCVPAVKSFIDSNYIVGFYGEFGSGESWKELREDILFFLQEQERTNALYLKLWDLYFGIELIYRQFHLDLMSTIDSNLWYVSHSKPMSKEQDNELYNLVVE